MVNKIIFFPMATKPVRDESDPSFSKTVLIYGNERNLVELGYFDFEVDQWSHFGKNLFLLKCWCYIPNPAMYINTKDWEVITPKGYKKLFF
ncbi:hypothetical protein [Flavobacterium cerinum]|uniref:Uncharacterized protein n=1 Tax=Flavobacterium cerinum TaxID=2502784 RepID=A0A3S3TV09_9FLAO|nr:hypothetical protein [Flavobacterium cerinum]RWW91829.1 hypothetical protein EPI11_17460 [Flavobacterium cerinum]